MKKFIPVLLILLTTLACRKPKDEGQKLPPPILYRMIDSNFYTMHRLDRPPYYDGRLEEAVFSLAYDQAFTVDTSSSVKQLLYSGVTIPRQGNSNTFTTKTPAPLSGEWIRISLDEDSIRIDCQYNTQENYIQYYYVRGVRK